MKHKRRYNRGFILAVIALAAVVVYLVSVGIYENGQQSAIKNVIDRYVKTYVGYNMLPSAYRTDTPNIPQDQLDKYISQMQTDISAYFAPGDTTNQYITNSLKKGLQGQTSATTVILDYQKTIEKYDSLDFSDINNVKVTFDCNTTYNGPTNGGTSLLNAVTTDTVVLKNVSGKWYVVYSDIKIPAQTQSLGGGIKRRVMVGG